MPKKRTESAPPGDRSPGPPSKAPRVRDLGNKGGMVAIFVERDGLRYLQISTTVGQSLTIYAHQLDWVIGKAQEAKGLCAEALLAEGEVVA